MSQGYNLLSVVTMHRLVLCTLVLYRTSVLASQPEVLLQQGTAKGLWANSFGGRPYAAFFGIPYAKPPVGKLRFKEPEAADPWLGIYNATNSPPECININYFALYKPHEVVGSEDCLYLNVFTSRLARGGTTQKLLDVIAYVDGVAFMSTIALGIDYLLDREIVLVTISYRLGPLGFFSTGDLSVPGNNGLKDQVLALKWIQQNIVAFGGDPDRVTFAGFSAGSASVHYHVLSPVSKGLFKAAICASGSSLNPWTFAENVKEKAIFVAEKLGCPTEDSRSMIDCLRHLPAEYIVKSTKHLLGWNYNPWAPYAPVVEPPGTNAFLPDTPMNLLKQRKGSDVPMLFSFTKDEGLFPAFDIRISSVANELKAGWNQLLPHLFDYNNTVLCEKRKKQVSRAIRNHYKLDLDSKEGHMNLIKALSDRLFITGIGKAAKLHSVINSSPVYLFRFSYLGKHSFTSARGLWRNLGVSHGGDIIFILPMKRLNTQETESDKQMSKEMTNLWISFVTSRTLEAPSVNQNMPNITFTDILGPSQLLPIMVDELGEEKFWDSLNLEENIESILLTHEEL